MKAAVRPQGSLSYHPKLSPFVSLKNIHFLS